MIIKYRTLAWIMCISFYSTVIIGFFITVYVTPFTAESDVPINQYLSSRIAVYPALDSKGFSESLCEGAD